MNKEQKEVDNLLSQVEHFSKTKIEKTAYNYLIDFTEIGFLNSQEGDRLLSLCIEIMQDLLERNSK